MLGLLTGTFFKWSCFGWK